MLTRSNNFVQCGYKRLPHSAIKTLHSLKVKKTHSINTGKRFKGIMESDCTIGII